MNFIYLFGQKTVIIIEISSNRVIEALDILIHSLINPLMLSETVMNEIKVIDDECAIAQHDDHYRATHLLASLARSNHPISQFSWGSFFFLIRKVLFFCNIVKIRYRKSKKFTRSTENR